MIIIRILAGAIAAIFGSWILPGVEINGFKTAIIFALILIILNATLRPLLRLIALPITLITLGLFLFVINGAIILFIDWLLDGFAVQNLLWAMALSLFISIFTSLFGLDKYEREH
ncbi:MAG: phage holin family protein [Candidatus Dojkabacteria bacterium]|nr:phage holin family protein [Candidatus Dojkabacteria bacterium]MDQ7020246.1 phage holin family protein [Candidatus Dojkabacteria bacterium]